MGNFNPRLRQYLSQNTLGERLGPAGLAASGATALGGLTGAGVGLVALADAFTGEQSAGEAAIDAGLIAAPMLGAIVGGGIGAIPNARRLWRDYRAASGIGERYSPGARDKLFSRLSAPRTYLPVAGGYAAGALAAGIPAALAMGDAPQA